MNLPGKLFLLFIFLPVFVFAQKEVPELWGHRVHDDARILSTGTVDVLERLLEAFEDSTTNQIAILTVESLGDEPIEMFGIRVAEKWKLGTEGRDNGAILLVSVNDRKMRIEVGQGLEGALPDVVCNQIIRHEMVPHFRRGDYDSGVLAAIDAITKAIKGEYKAEGGRGSRKERGRGSLSGLFVFLIILVIIIRNSRGNRGGGAGWSAATGWFIGSAMGRGFGGGGGGGGSSWGGGGGSFGGGGSSGSW